MIPIQRMQVTEYTPLSGVIPLAFNFEGQAACSLASRQ